MVVCWSGPSILVKTFLRTNSTALSWIRKMPISICASEARWPFRQHVTCQKQQKRKVLCGLSSPPRKKQFVFGFQICSCLPVLNFHRWQDGDLQSPKDSLVCTCRHAYPRQMRHSNEESNRKTWTGPRALGINKESSYRNPFPNHTDRQWRGLLWSYVPFHPKKNACIWLIWAWAKYFLAVEVAVSANGVDPDNASVIMTLFTKMEMKLKTRSSFFGPDFFGVEEGEYVRLDRKVSGFLFTSPNIRYLYLHPFLRLFRPSPFAVFSARLSLLRSLIPATLRSHAHSLH